MWTLLVIAFRVTALNSASYRRWQSYYQDVMHEGQRFEAVKFINLLEKQKQSRERYPENFRVQATSTTRKRSHAKSSKEHIENDPQLLPRLTNLPGQGELFEGDIIMDDRLRDAVTDGNLKKSAIAYGDLRWKNGIVPYEVSSNFGAQALLAKAIAQYHRRTCIRLRPREADDADYVLFNSDQNICASNVGRQGGKQVVTIGKDCEIIGTVLHEIMHVLGFVHEHSRPDRDRYISIQWENIKEDDIFNFNKYHLGEARNLGVPYNFNSVMHYRNNAFSKNGEDTIVARYHPNLSFGQRKQWSKGDVAEINRLYNCRMQEPEIYDGLLGDYST